MSKRPAGMPRSNLEIAAEYIVQRRADAGLLTDRELAYLKVELEKLHSSLAAGVANASQQRLAANIIDGLTNKKLGRPRQVATPRATFQLAMTLDFMVAEAIVRGDQDPLESVVKEAIELERSEGRAIDGETLLKYYRKGIIDMENRDFIYAGEIDILMSRHGYSLDVALSHRENLDHARIEHGRLRYTRAAAKMRRKRIAEIK